MGRTKFESEAATEIQVSEIRTLQKSRRETRAASAQSLTLQAVLQGNGRRRIGIEKITEGFGVEAKIFQLALNLLQALLELAVGNRMPNPMRWKVW